MLTPVLEAEKHIGAYIKFVFNDGFGDIEEKEGYLHGAFRSEPGDQDQGVWLYIDDEPVTDGVKSNTSFAGYGMSLFSHFLVVIPKPVDAPEEVVEVQAVEEPAILSAKHKRTAVEVEEPDNLINEAIAKLTRLRDSSLQGEWFIVWSGGQDMALTSDQALAGVKGQYGPIAEWTYGIDDESEQLEVEEESVNVQLIITLHKTIDNQLELLQAGLDEKSSLIHKLAVDLAISIVD